MIDLHCHILPGVDDGADSMSTALEMAKDAWNSGVRAVVATPHCGKPGSQQNFYSKELLTRFRQLQGVIRQSGCGLRIYPGMEIFVTEQFPEWLEGRKLLTLGNSGYLLVEFYFDESPEMIENALKYIQKCGLCPILAHPERYYCVQWKPELAAAWAESGTVLQLNRSGIQGNLGQAARDCAWSLLRTGKVQVVASDAHGIRNRRPELKSVLLELGEKLSWSYAAKLLMENPWKVLMNRPVGNELELPALL